jgi:hypothetical protein
VTQEQRKEAEALLKAYDDAMASQERSMADAKLIVMANYGDLAANMLRQLVRQH